MPDLTVILVNWNQLELTSAALASIAKWTQAIQYEVIVVDNGSSRDGSVTELPLRFPWIRFIANSNNLGFSKANNQGLRIATGRYILLLNNDTVQVEDALSHAVRYMDANPPVGALGILHLDSDGGQEPQQSAFAFPRPYREIAGLLLFARSRAEENRTEARDVDWVCGSFLLIRRACLDEVGHLDERFFIYDEDVDWCRRAQRAGWAVRFWPGARMLHIGSAAQPFMKDKTFVHFRSHLSYICKHHSTVAAVGFYFAMGLRLTLATGFQLLKWILRRSNFSDVLSRGRRQFNFLLLHDGRSGG